MIRAKTFWAAALIQCDIVGGNNPTMSVGLVVEHLLSMGLACCGRLMHYQRLAEGSQLEKF